MEPETAPRRESERRAPVAAADDDHDVFLDIPHLSVESLDLEVADLRARVSLQAEVLNLLRLNIGVDAVLGQVRLDLSNVEAQALLKVRLDKVAEILNRVLATIDSHPEMIEPLVRASVAAVDRAGTTVQQTLGGVGEIADQAVQRGLQNVDQLSRGVQEQVLAKEPPFIERSATVEADSREGGTETREAERADRPHLPGERRRYRGLPRRAERR